jgi:hypothetical protein
LFSSTLSLVRSPAWGANFSNVLALSPNSKKLAPNPDRIFFNPVWISRRSGMDLIPVGSRLSQADAGDGRQSE